MIYFNEIRLIDNNFTENHTLMRNLIISCQFFQSNHSEAYLF
jgi:hypothetical protein